MRLAEETVLRIGHETICLRPTLRAAFRLERRHGFGPILRAIADGNLGIMAEIIREGADERYDLPDLLDSVCALPLQITMQSLTEPLLSFVVALTGFDTDAGGKQSESAEGITFADYHAKLFQLATGWLGWTPAEAWDATPAEIIEAHKGRLDMLKAIFGSSDPDQIDDASPPTPTPAQRRAGLATLQAMAGGA